MNKPEIYIQEQGSEQDSVIIGGQSVLTGSKVKDAARRLQEEKIEVVASYGSIMLSSNEPTPEHSNFGLFVKGSDDQLYVNLGGEIWIYSQTPPGVELVTPMGAIAVDGDRGYNFLKGSDGNLWSNWWNADKREFQWAIHGRPDGVNLETFMGALTVDSRPYVFIKGSDGQLWCRWWGDSEWNWESHGAPEGVSLDCFMGALTVDQRPYVFIKGSDGQLWSRWWNGTSFNWGPHGTPSGVSIEMTMGALTVNQRPYLFVKGSDQNLWHFWWDGSQWSWNVFDKPEGVIIELSMGAVANQIGQHHLPWVFFKGGDGHVHLLYWSGKDWHWNNFGELPDGIQIDFSLGTVSDRKGRSFTFFKANDGNLWTLCYPNKGDTWYWQNLGKALKPQTVAVPV